MPDPTPEEVAKEQAALDNPNDTPLSQFQLQNTPPSPLTPQQSPGLSIGAGLSLPNSSQGAPPAPSSPGLSIGGGLKLPEPEPAPLPPAPASLPKSNPSPVVPPLPKEPTTIQAGSPEGLKLLGVDDGLNDRQRNYLSDIDKNHQKENDARDEQNRLLKVAQQTSAQTLAESQKAQTEATARFQANQVKREQIQAMAEQSAQAAAAKARADGAAIKDVDPEKMTSSLPTLFSGLCSKSVIMDLDWL